MAQLLFCLGRERVLSLSELCSYLDAEGLNGQLERIGPDVAIADVDHPPDPELTIRRLGGTIKIAKILARLDRVPPLEEIGPLLFGFIQETGASWERKLVFGLSAHPARSPLAKQLKKLGRILKERLESAGASTRYVLPLRGSSLSSAQVIENQLVARGWEFILTATDKGFWVAQTLAVQPLAEEAQRDMGKPARRLREGLLPPKVARIMVNLARTRDTRSILDPFCGSGVILMESLLLGLIPVGTDQSPEAVAAARQNLDWLIARAGREGNQAYELLQSKAQDLSLRFRPLSMDAVATEPYLGPPLTRPLTADKAHALSHQLSDMYVRALAEIRIVLRPGARCVFIVPVFRTRDGFHGVDLAKRLPLIGFREYNPLHACQGIRQRKTLGHSRPGQRVLRRILVLENRPE